MPARGVHLAAAALHATGHVNVCATDDSVHALVYYNDPVEKMMEDAAVDASSTAAC